MTSSGVNICIEHEHVARLDRLATMKGVSRSVVLAAALHAYLSPEGGTPCEAATARRLESLTRQLGRLERGQTLLIETLVFFIRDYVAGTGPLLEPHQEAARAQGRARFGQFIEQLARQLSGTAVSSGNWSRSSLRTRADFRLPAKTAPSARPHE